MNILELKGEVHEMLVEVKTEASVLKIRQVVRQVIEEEDSAFSFSEEQLEQLKLSIAESRMPENQIPYEDIKKEFAQWFKK